MGERIEKIFPEIPCYCGVGVMRLHTSTTPKNPGRRFYRCPNRLDHTNAFIWAEPPTNGEGSTSQASTSPPSITVASTNFLPSSDDEVMMKKKKKKKIKELDNGYSVATALESLVRALESLVRVSRIIIVLLVIQVLCMWFKG